MLGPAAAEGTRGARKRAGTLSSPARLYPLDDAPEPGQPQELHEAEETDNADDLEVPQVGAGVARDPNRIEWENAEIWRREEGLTC